MKPELAQMHFIAPTDDWVHTRITTCVVEVIVGQTGVLRYTLYAVSCYRRHLLRSGISQKHHAISRLRSVLTTYKVCTLVFKSQANECK